MDDNPECNTRNLALGFACRVRKNLEFIFEQRRKNEDVHEVTQIILSLLGLIVFPWEKERPEVLQKAASKNLVDLEQDGWPSWNQEFDTCCYPGTKYQQGTLSRLIRNLRNSIAHSHITFSSDNRAAAEVDITFENYQGHEVCWRATINAAQLKRFCEKFVDFVD